MGNWGFYFANSQLQQQSHGLIGTEQLTDIRQYLNTHRDKSIVLCMHHPSFEACPAAGCQLEDAQALHRAMAEHKNLKVVLAGHTHDNKQDCSKPYAQFTTPSSFAYAHHDPDPAKHAEDDFWSGHQLAPEQIGYRSLDLNEDGSFSTRVHWLA